MKVQSMSQARKRACAPLPCPIQSGRRILVVEDESDIRKLNTEVLTQSGYSVDAAENEAVAWETIQRHGYDLVLTDYDMPKANGVELVKKLRAARMALPVIMCTGTLPMEEFTRHPWLQPAAMLTKPYTIDELLGTVKQVLLLANGSSRQPTPPRVRHHGAPVRGRQQL
jgi:DNA-binding response OmpR family regulator